MSTPCIIAKQSLRREIHRDLYQNSSVSTIALSSVWFFLRFKQLLFEIITKYKAAVTGASGFLGTTLAIAIIESGADIVCLDLSPTPNASNWSKNLQSYFDLCCDRTNLLLKIDDVEDAAKKHQCQLSYLQLDVTDENAVSETFANFVPSLRYPVKGLVACAGLSLNGPATEFPASSFRRVLDINVTGTFLIAQATAREMSRTNTTGSMVLVASMSGYCSNKVDNAPDFFYNFC